MSIRFVSLLAEPLNSGYADLCRRLKTSGFPIEFVPCKKWEDARLMLERGDVELGAVCGLLYTKLRTRGVDLRPLLAPVLSHSRYKSPVYWSDVVVRIDSTAQDLSDLTEQTWLYNEPESYSGYRSFLAALQERELRMPRALIQTGSHAESLTRLLNGEGDFTVLDSTFLDHQPLERREQVRVVESLGPAPSPLTVGRAGTEQLIEAVRALESLPQVFDRFEKVSDELYDPVRADSNLSLLKEDRGMTNWFILKEPPERPFTSVEQQRKDQAVLRDIGAEMLKIKQYPPTRELPHGARFHGLMHEGLEHHHYILKEAGLSEGPLSIVGFLSRMKPTVDVQRLFEIDSKMLEQLAEFEGFLTYSPTEYRSGLWANLAVFKSPEARDHWASNSTHLKAIKELGHSSYDNVRLHLGTWPSIDEPMEWVATKYLHYTDLGLWRGVRTMRPPSSGVTPEREVFGVT